jgi:hypothetical protein
MRQPLTVALVALGLASAALGLAMTLPPRTRHPSAGGRGSDDRPSDDGGAANRPVAGRRTPAPARARPAVLPPRANVSERIHAAPEPRPGHLVALLTAAAVGR